MGNSKNKPKISIVEKDLLEGLHLAVGYWDQTGPNRDACWQDLHEYVYNMLEKYDPALYTKIHGPRRER